MQDNRVVEALCRIEMLGGLRVHVAGRTIHRFQTQKTGALLAYLALHPQRMIAREALAETLWPGDDAIAIRNRLNQAVSSLRRQLHPPGSEAGWALQTDHHTLSLNGKNVETDLDEFKRLIQANDLPAEDQIRRLTRAVELYQGEFLSGYYEEWALTERLFIGESYIEALDRLIKLCVEVGQPERAIELANRRLEADVFDESGHLRLMRLYIRLGRPRAATRQFLELKRILATEDDEPSDLANRLATKARLLEADGAAPPEEKWGIAVVESGDSRSAPPAALVEPRRSQNALPKYFTKFVGRKGEIERLNAWLAHDSASLLSITGPGGSGKTRLAVEFAQFASASRQVVWVSVSDIERPNRLDALICAALQLSEIEYRQDPQSAAIAALERMGPCLLILDNIDPLINEPSFSLEAYLRLTPTLSILTTTRQAIELDGEIVLALTPLPVPQLQPSTTLQELAANPSVDLFVNRAQLVRQDFQLTERTAQAILDLCCSLEGLPLALELAASWARSLSPAQMLERVSERLDFLATRRRDIAERHRSIRATIDASFDLLTDDLKELLLRLSTFSGGWNVVSATAVAPDMDAESGIQELLMRSLIYSESDDDSVRFYMLDTIRDYAQSKIAPDLKAETEWLHATAYLDFVRESEKLSNGAGARRVDREWTNVRAALRRLIDLQAWNEVTELGELLGGYWEYRERFSEGLVWLLEIESHVSCAGPVQLARIRRRIGSLAWARGDFELSARMIAAAIPELRAANDAPHLIQALFLRRLEEHRMGQFELARQTGAEVLELARQLGDRANEAHAIRQLANSAVEQGDWPQAQREYEASLEIGRDIGNEDIVGMALLNMGFLAVRERKLEAADAWLRQAAEKLERNERRSPHIDALICQLHVARMRNDIPGGRELTERILQTDVENWLTRWEAFCALAYFALACGRSHEATQLIGFAGRIGEAYVGPVNNLLSREYEEILEKCRANTGRDFDELYRLGRSLDLDGAREVARGAFVLGVV